MIFTRKALSKNLVPSFNNDTLPLKKKNNFKHKKKLIANSGTFEPFFHFLKLIIKIRREVFIHDGCQPRLLMGVNRHQTKIWFPT